MNMIETIFMITWDDLKESNGNNNGFYDSASDNLSENVNSFLKNARFSFFYPESDLTFENQVAMNRILDLHGAEIRNYYKLTEDEKRRNRVITRDHIKTRNLYDSSVCTIMIPEDKIVGLIFDEDDNPLDYMEVIEENIDLYINSQPDKFQNFAQTDFEVMLISLFLDLRMMGMELLEECKMHLEQKALKSRIEDQYENRVIKVFLYGIDSAGKSSLMRFLRTGQYDHNYFSPTKRFIVHKLKLPNNVRIIGWETPGQKSYRRTWLRGIKDCDLLVFMLDAADPGRMSEAKRAFWSIANRLEVKDVPLLVMVHKIDLIENRRDLASIENFFGLSNLEDRKWSIKFTSLVTKEGIKDAIDWVSETLNENLMSELARDLKINGNDEDGR